MWLFSPFFEVLIVIVYYAIRPSRRMGSESGQEGLQHVNHKLCVYADALSRRDLVMS